MPLPVSLDLVAQELDSLMDEMSAFVNRKNGEIVTVSDEELGLVEEEETDEAELAGVCSPILTEPSLDRAITPL